MFTAQIGIRYFNATEEPEEIYSDDLDAEDEEVSKDDLKELESLEALTAATVSVET